MTTKNKYVDKYESAIIVSGEQMGRRCFDTPDDLVAVAMETYYKGAYFQVIYYFDRDTFDTHEISELPYHEADYTIEYISGEIED